MKNTVKICTAALVLLCGCSAGKNSSSASSETASGSADSYVSISKTDYTQSDAEKLMDTAITAWCEAGCTCTSTGTVKISGDSVTGEMTVKKGSETEVYDAVLEDVRVSANDTKYTAVFTIRETASSDSGKKEETASPEDVTLKKFEISGEKPDPEKEEDRQAVNVYDEEGLTVTRLYVTGNTITFKGEFEGESGLFRIVLLDEDLKVVKEAVHLEKAGEFEETVDVKDGFYYIYLERNGGNWTYSYSMSY